MECTVDVRTGIIFKLQWIVPNNNQSFNENRATIYPTVRDSDPIFDEMQIGRSVLVINRVTADDVGEYICEVRDHSNNINRDKRSISVLGMFTR